jgi:hypothetical protein
MTTYLYSSWVAVLQWQEQAGQIIRAAVPVDLEKRATCRPSPWFHTELCYPQVTRGPVHANSLQGGSHTSML